MNLARLRVEDPQAAASVVDALWTQLAREDPPLFHRLWRAANRPSRRPAVVPVPQVEWLEDLPPVHVVAQRMPTINLAPLPAPEPVLAPEPAPTTLLLTPAPLGWPADAVCV